MKIALLAGEQSGDLLAGSLASALQQQLPSLSLIGVGGKEMQKAHVSCFLRYEALQTMGFSDVLLALPRLGYHFFQIRKRLLAENPAAIVTIDYPDFHLLLARALRQGGYKGKLIHYVSPSVWAWRSGRIETLERTFDALFLLFRFEEKLYQKSSLATYWVGHPLAELPSPDLQKEPLLALFPGSRPSVIEKNLPLQLQAARAFLKNKGGYRVGLSVAREELLPVIEKVAGNFPRSGYERDRTSLMRRASCAIAASGTVTLELALSHTPTVVTYPVSPLNYFLGRYLFRIPAQSFCLVNILAQRELFTEFIAKKDDPLAIAQALEHAIESTSEKDFLDLRQTLGESGASLRAAEALLSLLPRK